MDWGGAVDRRRGRIRVGKLTIYAGHVPRRATNPPRKALLDNFEITSLPNILTNKKHGLTARAAYNGHCPVGITLLNASRKK